MGSYDMCHKIYNVSTKYCKALIKREEYSNNNNSVPFSKYLQHVTYVCVLDACTAADLNLFFHTLTFLEENCSKTTKLTFDTTATYAM